MAIKNTVKISLAKIISLEIVCSREYAGEIIITFGRFFSTEFNGVTGICNLKPFDYCVSCTKRFPGGCTENDFHIIFSFPDNNESIRSYIGFIAYLREEKKISIECPSPNELFGE